MVLRKFKTNKSGNFAIITALAAVPVLTGIGLAVDYARLTSFKSRTQAALDASVLSAVMSDGSFNEDRAKEVYLENAHFHGSEAMGSIDYTKVTEGVWKGTSTNRLQLTFGGLFQPGFSNVGISSVAGITLASSPAAYSGCIHTLDQSYGSLSQNSGAEINAPDCTVYVGKSVTNAQMAGFNSGFNFNVKKVCVAGTLSYDNRTQAERTPEIIETNCETPGDFARAAAADLAQHPDLLAVRAGPMAQPNWKSFDANQSQNAQDIAWLRDYTDGLQTDDVIEQIADNNSKVFVLEPGLYGGMNFNSGNYTVIMKPGLYVIDGSWNINGHDFIGHNVSLFFTANGKLQPNSGMAPMFTAPTSGPFKGFLWWEDPAVSSWNNWPINDSKSYSYMKGVIYLPNREITLNSGAQSTYNTSLIVKKLMVNGGTKITFGKYDSAYTPDHKNFAFPSDSVAVASAASTARLMK